MRFPLFSLAKITGPECAGVFLRKRLFRRLDQAQRRPIIWVFAPPGFGKTALIGSYLFARKLPNVWYRMDEGDADVAPFFYYMGLAVQKTALRKGRPLPLPTAEDLQSLSAFSRNYFRELGARLSQPSFLVLDNFQQVPNRSSLQEVLRDGISELPGGITTVVISRLPPPPTFARLRASREMETIGWDDLRLTLKESKGIAGTLYGKKRFGGGIRKFHDRAEGWTAGLILLLEGAVSRKGRARSNRLSADAGSEAVFDYFASEIFEKLDRKSQALLIKIPFLSRITGEIAAALTGIDEAGEILFRLSRRHLFIEKQEAHPAPEFQCHPLFRDFLSARAEKMLDAAHLRRLRRASAGILLKGGQVSGAAELLQKTRDWKELTRLIRRKAPGQIAEGKAPLLEKWLEGIPEEIFHADPWLEFWRGVCRLPRTPSETLSYFEKAHKSFTERGDRAGQWVSLAFAVRAILNESSDFTLLDRWILLFERLPKLSPPRSAFETENQVVPILFFALVLRKPDHPQFEQWRIGTDLAMRRSPEVAVLLESGYALATHFNWKGDFSRSEEILEALRRRVRSASASPLAEVMLRVAEATCFMLKGKFEEGFRAVSEGLKEGRTSGIHVWDSHLLGFGALGALSAGDLPEAGKFLSGMNSAMREESRFDRSFYHMLMTWQALIREDYPTAFSHAQSSKELSHKLGATLPEAISDLALALSSQGCGEPAKASEHLERSFQTARRMKGAQAAFLCRLTEAQFALDRGEEGASLSSLREAMALGREYGYRNAFLWRPRMMARLCAKALANEIEPDYVKGLIRRRGLVPEPLPVALEAWPWSVRIYTLGRFSLVLDGTPLRFSGKLPRKPLLLLKVLIALGGRGVNEVRITDLLWPEADGDAARKALSVTLTRLRGLLGSEKAIEWADEHLGFNPSWCWIDVSAFQRLCAERLISSLEKGVALYNGAFLADEGETDWLLTLRDRLKGRYLRAVRTLGAHWSKQGASEKAIHCYERALEVDDLVEEFYRDLIVCYQALGREAEASAVYQRCKKTLAARLGIPPSFSYQPLGKE